MGLTTLGASYKWAHTVFVLCNWLVSLNIMSSRFTHVEAWARISSLFKAEHCFIVGIHHIFSPSPFFSLWYILWSQLLFWRVILDFGALPPSRSRSRSQSSHGPPLRVLWPKKIWDWLISEPGNETMRFYNCIHKHSQFLVTTVHNSV